MKIHLRQGYGGHSEKRRISSFAKASEDTVRKGEGEKENIELIISSCHIIITKK